MAISILSRFNFNLLFFKRWYRFLKFQSYQGSILTTLSLFLWFHAFLFQSYQGSILTKSEWSVLTYFIKFQSYQGSILTSNIVLFIFPVIDISILSRFNFNNIIIQYFCILIWFQSYQGSILTSIIKGDVND